MLHVPDLHQYLTPAQARRRRRVATLLSVVLLLILVALAYMMVDG